jgi:hypothetical protein
MDKFRVIVIALGTIIIVTFSLYNFGYYITPSVPQSGAEVRPVSTSASITDSRPVELTGNLTQVPRAVNGSKNTLSDLPPAANIELATYENRDKPENFYSIQFPTNMNVIHGNKPGSIVAESPNGAFSVDLVDIPDDSNVELYLLTNVKPSIESLLQNFTQIKFSSTSIGNNRAWELAYTWENATTATGSLKTFVEGKDEAAAITYTGTYQQLIDKNINSTLIQPVLQNFHWMI